MTTSAPASMAARNGTSSRRVEPGAVRVDDGQRLVGVEIGPAEPREVLRRPRRRRELRRPRTCAAASRATASGSLPNERMPMCGLAGLVARSHTGA